MKRKTLYITIALLTAVIILVGFSIGYRIDGLKIVKAGRVEIYVPYANSSINIDGKHSGYTHEDNEVLVYRNLKKGTHTIIVSNDTRFPWVKEIQTPYRSLTTLYPFNANIASNSIIIEKTDSSYNEIVQKIRLSKNPTKDNPIKSEDGSIEVYLENSNIFANWLGDLQSAPELFCPKGTCSATAELSPTVKAVNNIYFYPNRSDVIVISTEGGVFALEVDVRGKQNYQPILTSINPKIILEGNTLYALEDTTLGKITLE